MKELSKGRIYLSPMLINVFKLQIEVFDPSLTEPLVASFGKELNEPEACPKLISEVWRELIPWHTDITAAWKNTDPEQEKTKPRIDINRLSAIRPNPNFDELNAKENEIYVQTAAVLASFLLMIGKRTDGRRILLQLLIASEDSREDFGIEIQTKIDLLLEFCQAAWLDDVLDQVMTERFIRMVGQMKADDHPVEVQQNLQLATAIIGGCLQRQEKLSWALLLKTDLKKEDFELPEFVHEKMAGSADDFYRHSMGKVASLALENTIMRSASLEYCVQIHQSHGTGTGKTQF